MKNNSKYLPLEHGELESGEDRIVPLVGSRQSRRLEAIQRASIIAMAVILAILLAVLMTRTRLLWAIIPAPMWAGVTTLPDPRILRFTKDGNFHITVFNDLHFGEGEDNPPELGWGPISDAKTTTVMNTILDDEPNSQLVVINGDLITGENTYFHNSTDYLDIIVEPMVRRDKLWASTYGNHDHQFNLSSAKLLERERKYWRHSLTTDMIGNPEGGNSNYYLAVFGSSGDYIPALILWFFDSMGGSPYQGKTPADGRSGLEGVVHNSTTKWFLKTQRELEKRYGKVIPSLAFVHIPVYAMAGFQATGVDKNRQPGLNDDDPLSPQGVWKDQYTGSDIPFMAALKKCKGLMAVFSGHDHGDSWCMKWDRKYPGMSLSGNGIFFCFAGHTGYGGYGSWMRGSRQILLKESTLGKEVQTWIRFEDSSIDGEVMLNSTYGQDLYPAVEKKISHR